MAAQSYRMMIDSPFNPMAQTAMARHAVAACEMFERTTRRYGKPQFDLPTTMVDGARVEVAEEVVWQRPFCRLVHFKRDIDAARAAEDPRVLVVAPMSGHYATLLRGTVEALLPNHEVYITDWQDARAVPITAGRFDLDDYIDYTIDMIRLFKGDVHVFAVCQPSVPVLAAISVMESENDPDVPVSVILAGGPVDTRVSPTAVNKLAEEKGTHWFANNVIETVPWPSLGYGRAVYPGFLQLTGFMTMNLDRHINAHGQLFMNLIRGDGDSATKHREFYDEYLAVMDLTAEFYLQTIETVFVRHALPKGKMRHRRRLVDPGRIHRVALMTIEGEKDDITGIGQCRAAHDLTPGIPDDMKAHYEASGVGHYGIFNGKRYRNDIAPRIGQFIRQHDRRAESIIVMTSLTPAEAFQATGGSIGDVAGVAFTFQPANDAAPAPVLHLSQAAGTAADGYADDGDLHMAPLKLWAMAGRMMMDGIFGPVPQRSAGGRRQ